MVLLTVEDQGQGIPPETRARVFDKFFRVTNNSANSPGGLGMGLAIAHGIVDAHGGRIWIESGEQGRGTKVLLLIPIGDEEPANGANQHE